MVNFTDLQSNQVSLSTLISINIQSKEVPKKRLSTSHTVATPSPEKRARGRPAVPDPQGLVSNPEALSQLTCKQLDVQLRLRGVAFSKIPTKKEEKIAALHILLQAPQESSCTQCAHDSSTTHAAPIEDKPEFTISDENGPAGVTGQTLPL